MQNPFWMFVVLVCVFYSIARAEKSNQDYLELKDAWAADEANEGKVDPGLSAEMKERLEKEEAIRNRDLVEEWDAMKGGVMRKERLEKEALEKKIQDLIEVTPQNAHLYLGANNDFVMLLMRGDENACGSCFLAKRALAVTAYDWAQKYPQIPLPGEQVAEDKVIDEDKVVDEDTGDAGEKDAPESVAEKLAQDGLAKNIYARLSTAKYAEEQPHRVRFGYIDCFVSKEHVDMCASYGLVGYPSFRMFSAGVAVYNYDDTDFTTDVLTAWVELHMGRKYTVLETAQEVEDFTRDEAGGIAVIGFFRTDKLKVFGSFQRAAAQLVGSARFGLVLEPLVEKTDTETADQVEKARVQGLAQVTNNVLAVNDVYGVYEIRMYQMDRGQLTKHVYKGDKVSRKRIIDWIRDYSIPLLVQIKNENWSSIIESGIPYFHVWFANEKSFQKYAETLRNVGESFRGKIAFTYSVFTDSDSHPVFDRFFGAEVRRSVQEDSPLAMMFDVHNQLQWEFPSSFDFTGARIWDFCLSYDSFPQFRMSEPAPKYTGKEIVKKVVLKNYDQEVRNNFKDVVVLYYLSYDEYSSAMVPVFEEAVRMLLKDDEALLEKTVFYTMDMARNERPFGPWLVNFPTVEMERAGKSGPRVKYEGGNSAMDLYLWLSDERTVDLQSVKDAIKDAKERIAMREEGFLDEEKELRDMATAAKTRFHGGEEEEGVPLFDGDVHMD